MEGILMSQETNTREDISDIINKWKKVEGSLVMMLHSVQSRLGYVPRWAAMEISKQTGIALAKIYEVLTFYSFFKLTKPAKYQINVCIGTACYLKGAPELLKAIEKYSPMGLDILKISRFERRANFRRRQIFRHGFKMYRLLRACACYFR